MTLSVPVALLTALGPLLRGSWDLEVQAFLELSVIVCFCLWLILRLFVGYIPLPSRRALIWTVVLACLSALSTFRSPVHGLARPEWFVFLAGLWIFPAMGTVTKDQRFWIDEALHVSGYILVTLAFYQHFILHEDRPASSLVNQNVYAGTALMLLALAAEKEDWLLMWGLLWSMAWTHSVGAWLGLSMALAIIQRRTQRTGFWIGLVGVFICAVALYGKLGTPEVLHRWWWWKSAGAMALSRPGLGYGPGAFAYVLPAYLPLKDAGLFSLYAHQYFLQTVADLGIPFALIWFVGIWHCLARNTSHKRFGVIAALLNSLWDYTLSVPSNLWLFCYFAASSIPNSPEGINIPSNRKLPFIVLVLLLGGFLGNQVWAQWRGQQLTTKAKEALESGRLDQARRLAIQAAARIPEDPEVPRLSAAIEIQKSSWLGAVDYLKESIRLNPYRPSTWNELALAYRKLGLPDSADHILLESRRYQAQ